MTARRERDYYCPRCGALVQYVGFYRCTRAGCGSRNHLDDGHVEPGELVTAEAAARIRAETEVLCDPLF